MPRKRWALRRDGECAQHGRVASRVGVLGQQSRGRMHVLRSMDIRSRAVCAVTHLRRRLTALYAFRCASGRGVLGGRHRWCWMRADGSHYE